MREQVRRTTVVEDQTFCDGSCKVQVARSAKLYRGGLGSHKVLIAIGGHIITKEGKVLFRWPREAAPI